MTIVLKAATASCPFCDHRAHQIDTTAEHAREVVIAAIERHVAENHVVCRHCGDELAEVEGVWGHCEGETHCETPEPAQHSDNGGAS